MTGFCTIQALTLMVTLMETLRDGGVVEGASEKGRGRFTRRSSPRATGMTRGPAITQNDVDSVASFVEAASELDLEPFFGKDEQFSFSGTPQGPSTFYLGDRFHFRSALISFRRIWMPSEPSHWRNVVEICTRDGMPPEILNNASIQGGIIESLILKTPDF